MNANLILTGSINDAIIGDAIHWLLQHKASIPATGTLLVTLDSAGGTVAPARALHNVLAALPCRVDTYTIGRCDSAALLLFSAGTTRTAVPNASFLFHPVTRMYQGARLNSADLRLESELIEVEHGWIADAVAGAADKPRPEIDALMAQGCVLTADAARTLGLVTEIELVDVPTPPIWSRWTGV